MRISEKKNHVGSVARAALSGVLEHWRIDHGSAGGTGDADTGPVNNTIGDRITISFHFHRETHVPEPLTAQLNRNGLS